MERPEDREWPLSDDNWKHRSENMRCGTCMYFNNYRCRRHAPTMQGFPAAYSTDWCGDHKLDKESVRESELKETQTSFVGSGGYPVPSEGV